MSKPQTYKIHDKVTNVEEVARASEIVAKDSTSTDFCKANLLDYSELTFKDMYISLSRCAEQVKYIVIMSNRIESNELTYLFSHASPSFQPLDAILWPLEPSLRSARG